jgi:hypothetical protein
MKVSDFPLGWRGIAAPSGVAFPAKELKERDGLLERIGSPLDGIG